MKSSSLKIHFLLAHVKPDCVVRTGGLNTTKHKNAAALMLGGHSDIESWGYFGLNTTKQRNAAALTPGGHSEIEAWRHSDIEALEHSDMEAWDILTLILGDMVTI